MGKAHSFRQSGRCFAFFQTFSKEKSAEHPAESAPHREKKEGYTPTETVSGRVLPPSMTTCVPVR